MSSLTNLNKRLAYYGGNQQKRMQSDKLRSLKKALLYSYQAATIINTQGKQFRGLINPDKNKPQYDNKILSIPYYDICLNDCCMYGKTSDNQQPTNVRCGDVIVWKQTGSHWLVYLKYLQQDAYMRSEIRRCDQKALINNHPYWVYIRGPVETTVVYNQKSSVEWNDLNFSQVMYITKNRQTLQAIHRFAKIKIMDQQGNIKTWQVVAEDPYYGDGIIQVMLDQSYENTIQDQVQREELQKAIDSYEPIDQTKPYIEGPDELGCYEKADYTIHNMSGGHWVLQQNGVEHDLHSSKDTIVMEQISGRKGSATLVYRKSDTQQIKKPIKITGF